jgi:hypothetical protein
MDVDSILHNEPEDIPTLLLKGNIYESLGMLNKALKCYDMIINLQPNNVRATYAKASCLNK